MSALPFEVATTNEVGVLIDVDARCHLLVFRREPGNPAMVPLSLPDALKLIAVGVPITAEEPTSP